VPPRCAGRLFNKLRYYAVVIEIFALEPLMDKSSTLTRAELGEAVHNAIGLSRAESSQLVETVLDKVSDALIAGENVKISSFGSFILRDKNRRIGRNPKTGEEVPIEPRRVLTFRPSQILRERINEGA
jgi:integration host factor subunit alpha